MEVDYYWYDKNWKQRGEGKNVHLIVYYDIKKYRYIINTRSEGMAYTNIQVERKGDIKAFIQSLKDAGFRRIY